MSDRSSSLTSLQARKQLLIIEAEVHRMQMRQCLTDLKTSVRGIEETVTKGQSLMRMAGVAISGLSLFRRFRNGKGSFLSKLLTGISIGSSLWFANKARTRAD
ncbi:MAG TPA: hypothetical protein VGO67_06475 [Verrucomicrobiae bacterium]|jgi:hypothetical protein